MVAGFKVVSRKFGTAVRKEGSDWTHCEQLRDSLEASVAVPEFIRCTTSCIWDYSSQGHRIFLFVETCVLYNLFLHFARLLNGTYWYVKRTRSAAIDYFGLQDCPQVVPRHAGYSCCKGQSVDRSDSFTVILADGLHSWLALDPVSLCLPHFEDSTSSLWETRPDM